MAHDNMELVLGTVQFGLKYGLAGSDRPSSDHDVRRILAKAWEGGIRTLDTAPVYGDIEERLRDLMGKYPFKVVSKIPAITITEAFDEREVMNSISESVRKTQSRLGSRLSTLLFHRGADLLNIHGSSIWQAVVNVIGQSPVTIGVSCYLPQELVDINHRYAITVAQIPGNAFDQRFYPMIENLQHIEIHLRSVFLQGLLLLSPQQVTMKLPDAIKHCSMWRGWCQERGVSTLQAALSIVKGLPNVRYCVVGVDNIKQLDAILVAWSISNPMRAPELAINTQEFIDPRCWPRCNDYI